MDTKIIFLYCLADAISKALKMREDPQSKMTQAEIITFVMISALFYQGNYQMTHQVTQSCRYFSKLLSHSRLIRRITRSMKVFGLRFLQSVEILLKQSNARTILLIVIQLLSVKITNVFVASCFLEKNFMDILHRRSNIFLE